MALSKEQKAGVETALKSAVRNRLTYFGPNHQTTPFRERLLGNDRMMLFSFICSLKRSFGKSIFEPVAKELASANFRHVALQQDAGTQISSEARWVVQKILDDLTTADRSPNKPAETEAIRAAARQGEMTNVKLPKVDIKLVAHDGSIYLFDLKTAKPYMGGFKQFKCTLLEWTAVAFATDPNARVHTLGAIPYNPYEPELYDRWTFAGLFDLHNEIKVAEEFWDFLGGENTYEELLQVFQEVGLALRPEIDARFAALASEL